MYDILAKLDSIVDNINLDITETGEKFNIKALNELTVDLHTSLKESILNNALHTEKATSFALFISNFQTALLALLNKCTCLINRLQELNLFNTSDDSSITRKIIYDLNGDLERTLVFIQQYFSQYFDDSHAIPECQRNFFSDRLNAQLSQLIKEYDHTGIDEKLLQIAINPCLDFINGGRQVTYRQLYYLNNLLNEIRLMPHAVNDALTDALYEKLFFLNFNDTAFFDYFVKKLHNMDDNIVHLEIINQQSKFIRQLRIKSNSGLYMDLPNIQEQLCSWMEEEKIYLERSIVLTQDINKSQLNENAEFSKIELSISVSVLGFLLKLLVAAKIITNTNQSDIIRFFASHCKTSRQESISFDSLYNKYHQASLGAVNITKELLNNLIKLIYKLK